MEIFKRFKLQHEESSKVLKENIDFGELLGSKIPNGYCLFFNHYVLSGYISKDRYQDGKPNFNVPCVHFEEEDLSLLRSKKDIEKFIKSTITIIDQKDRDWYK